MRYWKCAIAPAFEESDRVVPAQREQKIRYRGLFLSRRTMEAIRIVTTPQTWIREILWPAVENLIQGV